MVTHIVWAVIVGFLSGVFVSSFFFIGFATLVFLLLLALVTLLISWLEKSGVRRSIFIVIALCAFALGALRVASVASMGDSVLDERLNTKVVVEGVVVGDLDVRESNIRVHVDVTALLVGSTSVSVRTGILAVVPAHTKIAYGDTVRVEGVLELPESFGTSEGRQFNYPMFLAKDGIGYMLISAEAESLGENHGNILQASAIAVKHTFLAGLQAVLPEPESGLAGGITVGDKRSIGKELSEVFKTASLIHVVVLSGYNITIVINMVRRGLVFLPRVVQYGGIASAVLFVVLMTGGAPSAVRAGAMSMIAVYARATARTFLALRILGVVALGMVAWNPLYLAFDPGFQLSILATLGLILFTEPLSARLVWMPEKFGLREIFSSTVATQITVLPLLLFQNGLFSLVALPANLLALVAVPYAMGASFVAALGGMMFGSYALPLAAPAYALLWYIIAVAQSFAALPFAAVSIPAFSAWWMLGAYILLGVAWLWLRK